MSCSRKKGGCFCCFGLFDFSVDYKDLGLDLLCVPKCSKRHYGVGRVVHRFKAYSNISSFYDSSIYSVAFLATSLTSNAYIDYTVTYSIISSIQAVTFSATSFDCSIHQPCTNLPLSSTTILGQDLSSLPPASTLCLAFTIASLVSSSTQ